MARKIKFESFKYRFLIAAQGASYRPESAAQLEWNDFVCSLAFTYEEGKVVIVWLSPSLGRVEALLHEPKFYLRGDREKDVNSQLENSLTVAEDPIKLQNKLYFKDIVARVAKLAGFIEKDEAEIIHDHRMQKERVFHDSWAGSAEVEKIDVCASNEVCTAPEMRYISQRLGNIKDKHLLDIGCGLGEASVYFAILGADVTASDLSQGMLDATARLAQANGVSIKQHLASAENMQLPLEAKFDIIYAGNLLHHVEIEKTINRIKPYLAIGGVFVTWDPLVYNPVINVYRSIALDVRTPDEHPLKWSDIQSFHKHFETVETRYFWLTTLLIFVIMALAQRRNPNKERFWKVVIEEGEKWSWLYRPLEKIDRLLLWAIPPLRLLCWNVVVVASVPVK